MTIPCHVKDGKPNNAKKLNEATGEIFKVPKSSITTQSDFSEAIEKIKQFFHLQFNYRIREANEDLFND